MFDNLKPGTRVVFSKVIGSRTHLNGIIVSKSVRNGDIFYNIDIQGWMYNTRESNIPAENIINVV